MKSITKYNITNEQIRATFKAAGLDEVAQIKEISDGWYNSVFSAEDKFGKKYIIKIAPEKSVRVLTHEQNLMASEVAFYKLLNEKTEIKTPKIIFSDFSEKIIPTAYFIMEFLEGERLDKAKLSPAEKAEVAEKWAWILSEFHKIEGTGYGYSQLGLKSTWKDAFTHMTRMLIDDAASFNKECKIGKKLMNYIDKNSALLENVPCVLVNFDLHSMNLFCNRESNGKIELAVLDLERGFCGDPIGDFITPDALTPLEKKNSVERYNRYAAKSVGTGKDEQIRYNLMLGYLATIMYTERFSRFKGTAKFFNKVYIFGTLAYKVLAKRAFSALKRLSND